MGERITKRLSELKLTQRELAATVGVTEITMSRYIHGGRMPNVVVIASIAKALGVTTDYLLGLE